MGKGNGDALTSAVQESLVALLCYDKEGHSQVKALVPVESFDVYYRQLAGAAVAYKDKYKKVPGEHTLDLINTLRAKHPDDKSVYKQLFASLNEIKGSINRAYVIDQASRFHRRQRLKAATTSVISIMQSGQEDDLEKAENVLDRLRKDRVENAFSPGLRWNDPRQALAFLDEEEDDEPLMTGVQVLDKLGIGPRRKQMWLLLGLTNRGKSWHLNAVGKNALLRRKRVLHVTLEMSEREVAKRYVQTFFAVGNRDEAVTRYKPIPDSLGFATDFEMVETKGKLHFMHPKARARLSKRINRVRTPLIIKQFPTYQLTMPKLEAYLDSLEAAEGFIPDVLIVDYPDLFRIDAKHRREETGVVYASLRGLAVERNMYLATVSQVNRDAMKSKTINEGKVAEDFSKTHIADTVVTYNQTDSEYQMGLARMFVAKSRGEQKHQAVLLSQAYSIGQFCLSSTKMKDTAYWQFVNDMSNSEDDDEKEAA